MPDIFDASRSALSPSSNTPSPQNTQSSSDDGEPAQNEAPSKNHQPHYSDDHRAPHTHPHGLHEHQPVVDQDQGWDRPPQMSEDRDQVEDERIMMHHEHTRADNFGTPDPNEQQDSFRRKGRRSRKRPAAPAFSAGGEGEHLDRRPHKRHVDEYSEVMRQEMPSANPLVAYAAKPINTRFSSQHNEEDVILLLRQHPITQLKWVFIALVLVVVPFLFSTMPAITFLPPRFEVAGLIGWYLLVMGFVLEAFLSWFYNVYIITDERVIDVDFHSLIYKNISAAKIDNIEDVSEKTGGALRAIFNFGTVQIQTAAAKVEFEFENVPFPAKVTSLLNELILEEEREKIEGRVS